MWAYCQKSLFFCLFCPQNRKKSKSSLTWPQFFSFSSFNWQREVDLVWLHLLSQLLREERALAMFALEGTVGYWGPDNLENQDGSSYLKKLRLIYLPNTTLGIFFFCDHVKSHTTFCSILNLAWTSEDAGASHVFCYMSCLELFLHAMKKTLLKTAGNINFHPQIGHSWPVWIPIICKDKTSCQYALWSSKTSSKPCKSAQESLESDNIQIIIFPNLEIMVMIHREVNFCLENVCPCLFPFPNALRWQQARYW